MPVEKTGYKYVVNVTWDRELTPAERESLLDNLQAEAKTTLQASKIPASAIVVTNGQQQKKTSKKKKTSKTK